ncbi:MAG: gliding motility-associated C-terminal domain-containing protein [Lachnospiraceae bacterium]|nr:gliding motility-associated C-terminal domain-containing protein [Lachnospiraceae bacterium]
MKKILTSLLATNILLPCFGQLSFIGTDHDVITITPGASTGLNDIYVLYNTSGVSLSYMSENDNSRPEWYKFGNLGGGYAELIPNVKYDGFSSSISIVEGDTGYIIRDGKTTLYFWVVDYSRHPLSINGIELSPESDCSTVALDFNGSGGEAIRYYTINGQGKELGRDVELKFHTMEFDSATDAYSIKESVETFAHIGSTIYATAPLCNTDFTLSGDRFLRQWGLVEEASTPVVNAIAVEATTSAEQHKEEIDNEQSSGSSGNLGGSAPVDITFMADVTDAVVFTEWQISKDSNFDIIDYRETNTELTYTFRDAGTEYVRFMASNSQGSCDYYSPTYEVSIGESDIKCPNAFSPGASEGINDVWKVSYKSIVSFECHIFNRWGVKVASFNNPADGWDGKYNGKLVPAGVYYYVINAKGADGKTYKLKGDINIINYKRNSNTGNVAN